MANCRQLLDEVAATDEEIIVTKQGSRLGSLCLWSNHCVHLGACSLPKSRFWGTSSVPSTRTPMQHPIQRHCRTRDLLDTHVLLEMTGNQVDTGAVAGMVTMQNGFCRIPAATRRNGAGARSGGIAPGWAPFTRLVFDTGWFLRTAADEVEADGHHAPRGTEVAPTVVARLDLVQGGLR